MKFILSEPIEEKQLTLADVAVNQFFVNRDGWLCQKVWGDAYIQIANSKGELYADYYTDELELTNQPIQRILPNVERIEF